MAPYIWAEHTGDRSVWQREEEEGRTQRERKGPGRPSKVCHFLQLGPTSQFPKCPQIAPPPGNQVFNTQGTFRTETKAPDNGDVLEHL